MEQEPKIEPKPEISEEKSEPSYRPKSLYSYEQELLEKEMSREEVIGTIVRKIDDIEKNLSSGGGILAHREIRLIKILLEKLEK